MCIYIYIYIEPNIALIWPRIPLKRSPRVHTSKLWPFKDPDDDGDQGSAVRPVSLKKPSAHLEVPGRNCSYKPLLRTSGRAGQVIIGV